MAENNYEQYGTEWEKEMMKLTKKALIRLLRKEWAKKETVYKLNPANNKFLYGVGLPNNSY